jgi:hypothetical protein
MPCRTVFSGLNNTVWDGVFRFPTEFFWILKINPRPKNLSCTLEAHENPAPDASPRGFEAHFERSGDSQP